MNNFEITKAESKSKIFDGKFDLDGFSPVQGQNMAASISKKISEFPPALENVNIGIEKNNRKEIADGLSSMLADSYVLYLQTQNFHWNVTGLHFQSLHLMFGQQYLELAEGIDVIAERIRSLGYATPATFSEFLELSSIKEERGIFKEHRMLAVLCEGHEAAVRTARRTLAVANEFHDFSTADTLTQRMQVHEKTAWMLRSALV